MPARPARDLSLDLSTLIDEPLCTLEPYLVSRPDDRIYVFNLARKLRARITDLANAGLDWGVCHQDMTLDNVHLTIDGRIIFYDFDSGGPGRRSMDFQGIYRSAMYNTTFGVIPRDPASRIADGAAPSQDPSCLQRDSKGRA